MVMVSFSFVLKLTFQKRLGAILVCAVLALFVLAAVGAASAQSKTQIADWLARPDLMLDTSVLLTIDVAFQICFCILSARFMGAAAPSRTVRVLRAVCLWVPGLLIFPALFAALTWLIFSLTGVDFDTIGRGAAVCTLVLFPLLAWGVKAVLPEEDIRLELIFMLNLIVAALGIVATVNGRTAAVGTNSINTPALAAIAALIAAGIAGGLVLNRYITAKKISKL